MAQAGFKDGVGGPEEGQRADALPPRREGVRRAGSLLPRSDDRQYLLADAELDEAEAKARDGAGGDGLLPEQGPVARRGGGEILHRDGDGGDSRGSAAHLPARAGGAA